AGKLVYVANGAGNSVATFAIDAHTGGLTRVATTPFSAEPWAVAIDPAGRVAYVANNYRGDVARQVSAHPLHRTGAPGAPAGAAPRAARCRRGRAWWRSPSIPRAPSRTWRARAPTTCGAIRSTRAAGRSSPRVSWWSPADPRPSPRPPPSSSPLVLVSADHA